MSSSKKEYPLKLPFKERVRGIAGLAVEGGMGVCAGAEVLSGAGEREGRSLWPPAPCSGGSLPRH